jgi:hypothetical protein
MPKTRLSEGAQEVATEVALADAKEFYLHVVKPNVEEFTTTPSQFRTAVNAATSLFHMHDWLYEFKRTELEGMYKHTFESKGIFWRHIETLVPSSKFIRDLANASKHVQLTRQPSTSMDGISGTVIRSSGFGEGGFGVGRFGGQNVMMKDAGAVVSLDDCVRELMHFWGELVQEFYPRGEGHKT